MYIQKQHFCLLFLLFIHCKQKDSEKTPSNDNQNTVQTAIVSKNSAEKHVSFIEEILVGFEMSAVAKHMVQTPYKYLGEDNLRMNYEGIDDNKVNHFVSFGRYYGDELQVYVYNIDFKNNNEHLVNNYMSLIREKLETIYGQDFETGYNDMGNFVVEWTLEGALIDLTTGTNFITLEVKAP